MVSCPSAVGWGTVADWASVIVALLAAVATVWAVLVALKSGREAKSLAEDLQAREWQKQKQSSDAAAARLAVAFHHELHIAIGLLEEYCSAINPDRPDWEAELVRDYLLQPINTNVLALLSRFADRLDGFASEDAVAILAALSHWYKFTDGPPPDAMAHVPPGVLRQAAQAVFATGLTTRQVLQQAKDRLPPYFHGIAEIEIRD